MGAGVVVMVLQRLSESGIAARRGAGLLPQSSRWKERLSTRIFADMSVPGIRNPTRSQPRSSP